MRRSLAPSSLVGQGFIDASQAPETPSDLDMSSVLLPARNKRKFVAPASVDPGQTAPAAGGSKVQRCTTVPYAQQQQNKDTSSPSGSAASAQYFSVLYAKRATNKVCPALSVAKLVINACIVEWCAISQKKKNKSYSDGILVVKEGNACTLFNEASCRFLLCLYTFQTCRLTTI